MDTVIGGRKQSVLAATAIVLGNRDQVYPVSGVIGKSLKEKGCKAPSASKLRRWIRLKAYDDAHGTRTLGGKARRPGRPPKISDVVLLISLPGWCKRRTRSSFAHWEKVRDYCTLRQFKCPSYSTFRRWSALFDKDFLERNIMKYLDWYAKYAPTIMQEDGLSNDAWIPDACDFKFLVTDGVKIFRPCIVVYIDHSSRLPMGWMISKNAINSNDTIGALKVAILPKRHRGVSWGGLPKKLKMDNGSPFKSGQFLANLGRLGIEPDYCYPECPQEKGRIERFFRTFGEQFADNFEDKVRSPLVSKEEAESSAEPQAYWDTVVHQFHEYMVNFCLNHRHSALKKRTPYEAWQDRLKDMSRVQLDYKAIADKLYVEREITATKAGIEILDGQFWINDEFAKRDLIGQKLTVQLPPDGVTKGTIRAFLGETPLGVMTRPGRGLHDSAQGEGCLQDPPELGQGA